MKKITLKSSLVATVAVLTFAVTLPVAVAAQPVRAEEAQAAAQERKDAAQAKTADKKEAAQTRLTEAKLKVCKNREKTITNIMARIADRGEKQIDLFGKIADRTEAFYTDKGKTLSTYDALVADVAAKKADAQAAINATKATSVEFKCDGTDPKGVASSFKDQMKAQDTALKAYKTSVKNLIVGVKSIQGTTSSTDKSKTGGDQ